MSTTRPPRRAAVLGHPVAHSLSPVLHRAAYDALGLDGWSYEAIDTTEEQLPAFVNGLDASWAGLSLTMPLKHAVIPLLDHVDPLANVVGAVNTLVVQPTGGTRPTFVGTNTDVHGLVAALREGLRFVWSVPLFRALLGPFVVINVAFGSLMVGINLELVRTGTAPLLIGLVDLAVGVGVLVGAVLAPRLVARVRAGALVVAALGVLAAGSVVMAVLGSYAAYLAVLPFALLLVPAVNAGLSGYAAAVTPPQLQGRLASVLGLTGLAAGPLVPLVGSGLLDRFGLGTALAVLAGLLVVTVAVLSSVRPLWRVGTPDTWADDAAALAASGVVPGAVPGAGPTEPGAPPSGR